MRSPLEGIPAKECLTGASVGRDAGECNCLRVVGTPGTVCFLMFQYSGPFLGNFFLISFFEAAQEYKLDVLAKEGACF